MYLSLNLASPCKGCEERHSGCHSECEKFLAWKSEYEAKRAEINKQKDQQRMLDDVRNGSARKMMRKYGIKGKEKTW